MPPKLLAKNSDRASGVLPVTAAIRSAAATTTKGPQARLKLEVRRLPPGLTLTEFEEILGEEWKLGSGKVDWLKYHPGKVRQSAGKMPEQSRCYIHLLNEPLLKQFEARFLEVEFQDKAGTCRNQDLKNLPPTIGFAPNQRTPLTSKSRMDSRQGTIDQDPEFIAFLEGETQPIHKPAALDAVGVEKKEDEKPDVKSTPLIEALREKKANKAKVAETKAEKKEAKGHARSESKDNPSNSSSSKKDVKDEKTTQQQEKVEQASKEAVKALNKQVANKQQPQQQRPASPQQARGKVSAPGTAQPRKTPKAPKQQQHTTTAASPSNVPASPSASAANTASQTPAPQRAARQRGNAAEGIKKMLQKDLGIKPKPAPAAQNSSTPTTKTTDASKTTASTAPKNAPQPEQKQSAQPPKAPAAKGQPAPTAPKQQQTSNNQSSGQSPHKAYLKHANPSQGMTEILIQQALSQYGEMSNVTIDPRKGTAIAIFKDADGMKKAIEAKRVPVASGNVEVLEFKDRAPGGGRGGFRGGRGGGRGGRGQTSTPTTPSAPKADAGS